MRSLTLAALTAAVALGMTSAASAQYYYVQSPPPYYVPAPAPIVPVVSYSYYPPAPVYQPAPVTSYYAPAPTVAYYPQAVVPAYGVYGAQTTTYGLGIFRPRQVTTQYYYLPR